MSNRKRVRITETGIVSSSLPPEEEHLQDRFDVAKLTVNVGEEVKRLMGRDYVLAKLSEQQKEFVVEQVKVAVILESLFKELDSSVATDIKNTILTETQALALLERNKKDNHIVKWVLEVPDEESPENIETEKTKDALRSLLTPKEKT